MTVRHLEFQVLGPLAVALQGAKVPLGGHRQRLILALLLVNVGQTVPAERLIEQVWVDASRPMGTGALRNHIWQLRRLIQPDGGRTTSPGLLLSEQRGYRLAVERDQIDSCQFEQRLAAARATASSSPQDALEKLAQALAIWRGPAFGDLASALALCGEATRLDQLVVDARQLRSQLLIETDEHSQARAELELLVRENPERERLWALLMIALYRSGRQTEALRCFQEARIRLIDEVGVEPGPELRQVEQAILRHDPDLGKAGARPDTTLVVRSGSEGGKASSPTAAARPATFLLANSSPFGWMSDRCHTIAAEAIKKNGGQSLRHGDGVGAVFDRAVDALAAAFSAQAQAQISDPNALDGTRLRIAIHTGHAETHNDKYVDPVIDHCARMRDAAHAGQTLVSGATRELIFDSLPAKVRLIDIGTWLFEGHDHPGRVYQLDHPDLVGGFPPLRSARSLSAGLPRIPTTFVGRQDEMAAIARALVTTQLVTLTGEGGVGKSRLASEVAEQVDAFDYPDGLWFCDMSCVEETDGIAEQIANTLGLATPAGTNVRAKVVAHLRGSQLLILIDNADHFRSTIGKLIGDILTTGSVSRFLVTSRAPLRTVGEQVISVDPLATPLPTDPHAATTPAVQLLIDRALACGAPVADDDFGLVEVARKLDGLPLAIELAAPHLATMSSQELAQRLDHRFELLTGIINVSTRQTTLRATLDMSFGLLSPDAQVLLQTLAVFRGGWSLDAAEAVGTAAGLQPDRIASLVSELVEQSMIRADLQSGGAARYRMLETMSAYTTELLADRPDLQAAVAKRHAEHFISLTESAAAARSGPLESAWVRAVDQEFDNLRAACRWAIDTRRPTDGLRLVTALVEDHIMRDRLEIGRWAEALASLPSATDEPLCAVALGLAATTAMAQFRLNEALSLARKALDVERDTGGTPAWIPRSVLALLSGVGVIEDDHRAYLKAIDEIGDIMGDPFAAAVADFNRVNIAMLSLQPEQGRPAAERLLDLGRRTMSPTLMAMGLYCHGLILTASEPELAEHELSDALDMASSAHNTVIVQFARRALQQLGASSGDHSRALIGLTGIAWEFQRSGNISQQLLTVVSMLDSLVALEEWRILATVCGALSQTPWRDTATRSTIEKSAVDHMDPAGYEAAYRAGQAMHLDRLVKFVSDAISR